MEKPEVIDIQMAENGAVFIEYDDKGGQYYSVAEGDNQFKVLGEIIFDEIIQSNLCSGKYRLTIKFEEL